MRILKTIKNIYWRWRLRGEVLADGFDSSLYCRLHRDVAVSGLDGRVHYLRFGRAEGRDPHPDFSASGYLYQGPSITEREDAFLHYERIGREEGYAALPEWNGTQKYFPNSPTWLVCGHQAGREIYGGERSLLDVLAHLSDLGVNAIVVLPSALNRSYIKRVMEVAYRVAIVPYGWWHRDCPPLQQTLRHFERLLREYRCDAMYVNTAVLDEPLLAARAVGVQLIVHVRELPAYDPDLCETLGASADEIRERLMNVADIIVANSDYTAQCLGIPSAMVVPNGVDISAFESLESPAERGEVFSVGIVSSNLPKKGINDFVRLASELELRELSISCLIIGPETTYLQSLKSSTKPWPGNLKIRGYSSSPQEAIAQLDVLVNLSHFYESFGRTVLEAMAAGRPVVAYERGAVRDLVVHLKTGYLVPYRSSETLEQRAALVAEGVEQLFLDQGKYRAMSTAARNLAAERYSKEAVREALKHVLQRSVDLQRSTTLNGRRAI
ncbi:glycosyltransferase family 4 protein [Marinimicrobium locisalis]|uniref:glycosyltransferase family 4 protein n=1 Tax=Marinimicrobium locisalis TaxID=546022 RepID=UPI00322201D3